jgi:L-ascorbate metabolism protein UlaG (beta-lactamase superfamily)
MLDVTFINHSTTLIRINDLCILTDPIWSNWLGLPIFGVRRLKEPGIRLEELPKIDVVLLSHNHFDHMDIPTLRVLRDKFNPVFIAGLGNKEFLNAKGIERVEELDWWEKLFFDEVIINFVPAQHWSGRMPWDIDTTLWGGFVIETKGGNIYFMGDGAYNENHFNEIKNEFSSFKVSLLPISPSDPIFKIQHMNPDDAVRAHKVLNSKLSIGIHTGTFKLGYEQNIKDLKEALKTNNVKYEEFIMLNHGETRSI